MNEIPRLCLYCAKFVCTPRNYTWSDESCWEDAQLMCGKRERGRWTFDDVHWAGDLRKMMKRAETCELWEEVKDE